MADEKTKFQELTRMKYADQAKWFLNGFWDSGIEKEAENVWKCANKFIELDITKKKEGNELDEFLSHKFLESLGETLTVIQLRERLRKIDLDANGKMALLEYLAFRYSKGVRDIILAPQGDNTQEIEEATQKFQAVQDAFTEVQNQLDEQTKALSAQKAAEAQAKKDLEDSKQARAQATRALEDQKKAEETVRKAEAELKAAVDDLKSQEDAFHNQLKSLEQKSKDPNAGQVAKSKAAAELAQLKQEDPLPLRKAKITQEAALRKVEKERKASEEATAKAEQKATAAHEAEVAAEHSAREAQEKSQALEEQKLRVEEAYREAEVKLKEAQDFLEEAKQKGGVSHGAIWWLERELKEAQKYLPKKKQTA